MLVKLLKNDQEHQQENQTKYIKQIRNRERKGSESYQYKQILITIEPQKYVGDGFKSMNCEAIWHRGHGFK
jgi:hypothetical protein